MSRWGGEPLPTAFVRYRGALAALREVLESVMNSSGVGLDRVRQRCPLDELIRDLDGSVSKTCGRREGSAYNGHLECACCRSIFGFNHLGDLKLALLRHGNVASADDWRSALEPVVARYRDLNIRKYFRGDTACAIPELYSFLEGENYGYVIRLKSSAVLERHIQHLLTRPVGRPPKKPVARYHDFMHQAAGWDKARRAVAKVEWHQGKLFPRVGFILTNLSWRGKRVVRFYNLRGTPEEWTKEGKNAVKWTKLSCHGLDSPADTPGRATDAPPSSPDMGALVKQAYPAAKQYLITHRRTSAGVEAVPPRQVVICRHLWFSGTLPVSAGRTVTDYSGSACWPVTVLLGGNVRITRLHTMSCVTNRNHRSPIRCLASTVGSPSGCVGYSPH